MSKRNEGRKASDALYIENLASPLTVNTMREATLKAFADLGKADATIPASGRDSEAVVKQFGSAGVDPDEPSSRSREQIRSTNRGTICLEVISSKSAALQNTA